VRPGAPRRAARRASQRIRGRRSWRRARPRPRPRRRRRPATCALSCTPAARPATPRRAWPRLGLVTVCLPRSWCRLHVRVHVERACMSCNMRAAAHRTALRPDCVAARAAAHQRPFAVGSGAVGRGVEAARAGAGRDAAAQRRGGGRGGHPTVLEAGACPGLPGTPIVTSPAQTQGCRRRPQHGCGAQGCAGARARGAEAGLERDHAWCSAVYLASCIAPPC
jgi:hypothetical protein